MKAVPEYLGIIEKPGTLIESSMGSGETECEICEVSLTTLPGITKLSLKQMKN